MKSISVSTSLDGVSCSLEETDWPFETVLNRGGELKDPLKFGAKPTHDK
jgi:hypothetical protein